MPSANIEFLLLLNLMGLKVFKENTNFRKNFSI